MSYIQELQEVIRKLHGVESQHLESVQVKEMYNGKTVWEGVVEIFRVLNHPKTDRAYAWAHDGKNPLKSAVAVLHLGPITSATKTVQAALVQDFRSAIEPEES